MQNPFKNLVGLKGVTVADTYINDLPGLSIELVDALATESEQEEDEPALVVWNRIQNAALNRLESEIVGCLSSDSTFSAVLASVCQPEPIDGVPSTPEDHYEGILIQVPASPNSRIRVVNLVFMAEINAEVTAELVVVNTRRSVFLKEENVTVVPGVNIIPVSFDYPLPLLEAAKLFVGIATDNLSLLPLSMPQWNKEGYIIKPAYYFGGVTTVGVTVNQFYLEAEHQRTITSVIPRFADQLKLAYLYLCGSLLMTEKLASVNFNLFTNTNRDFTIEQEEKLMKDFKSAVKPVARLVKQHLGSTGNLQPKADSESGYTIGSFV